MTGGLFQLIVSDSPQDRRLMSTEMLLSKLLKNIDTHRMNQNFERVRSMMEDKNHIVDVHVWGMQPYATWKKNI
jgi:hypothetical protein